MRFPSFSLCIFICLATLSAALPARADEITLLHPGIPGSLYDVSAKEFANRVNRRLPPVYRLSAVAAPSIGDGPALLHALNEGSASLVLASSAMLTISDRFAIFELPFLISSRDQIRNIRATLLPAYLQPAAHSDGFHILGVWESGFHQITNDARPISRPADLKGMSIAVTDNRWRAKVLHAFGAEPVPMASSEVPEAIAQRRVEAQESPLADIAALGLAGIQRHLTLSDHIYSPAFLIARQELLQGLPAEVRDAIVIEAAAMEGWVQKAAIALDSDLVDRLDRGMEVHHADVEAFRNAGKPVYGEFIRAVPDGLRMIEMMQSTPEVTAANRSGK